ncbi:MAG: DHH family phosphoesterase, partial [Chloroflexi bacterium]|nr:DHH family phosphoesterase [Chloroflexota bacterium]
MIAPMTRWLDPLPLPADALESLHLPSLVAQALIRRGINTPAAARAFLHPDDSPSALFPGVEKAVEIINLTIRNKETICVWGDFDVDGQTSTALLVETLQALGAKVVFYVPIRGKENHGVHIESLKPILDNGAKLILTCDTGVTAHEAVEYCNVRGVDVIITDHHEPGETLPKAKAIFNPKLLPAGHSLENLAGVGVAYKLAEALLNSEFRVQNSEIESADLLDLTALGLIADVALLKGET